MADGGFSGDTLASDQGEGVMKTHAELVDEQHHQLDREMTQTDDAQTSRENGGKEAVDQNMSSKVDRAKNDESSVENQLLNTIISAGCNLESQARRIMMNQLGEGSAPQTLLRADRNQQLRDMRSLELPEKEMKQIMSEEASGDPDLMQQVGLMCRDAR